MERHRFLKSRFEEKDSMLYWYPLTRELNIPQPETEIVEIPNDTLQNLTDVDGGTYLSSFEERLGEIFERLGPFPIFLRTDMSSQKYAFRKTCRVPNARSFFGHVLELVDLNMKSGISDSALVFRRWIDLDAGFFAFDGLPISVEARAFAGKDRTTVAPYWSEGILERWMAGNTGQQSWKETLGYQNRLVMQSTEILKAYARIVHGKIGGGSWAIDFALGRDARWYLIDMETAGRDS